MESVIKAIREQKKRLFTLLATGEYNKIYLPQGVSQHGTGLGTGFAALQNSLQAQREIQAELLSFVRALQQKQVNFHFPIKFDKSLQAKFLSHKSFSASTWTCPSQN